MIRSTLRVFLFFWILQGVASSIDPVFANDLVAEWKFNGDTLDSSGNNYHLVNSGAELVADRFGNPNGAYYFSRDDTDYMTLPDLDDEINYDKDWSINLWMNISHRGAILSATDGGSGSVQFGVSNFATKFAVQAESNDFRTYWEFTQTETDMFDRWVMMTVTWDKSGEVKSYINGELIESDNMGVLGDFYPNTRPVLLGASNNGFANRIDAGIEGAIDDITIYEGTLSVEVIMSLYQNRPSMEFRDDFTYGHSPNLDSLPGWDVENRIDIIADLGPAFWSDPDETVNSPFLELNFASGLGPGAVTRELEVVSGRHYRLEYAWAGRRIGSESYDFSVSVDGVLKRYQDNLGTDGFQEGSIEFIASSSSVILKIQGHDTSSDTGGAIDWIQLVEASGDTVNDLRPEREFFDDFSYSQFSGDELENELVKRDWHRRATDVVGKEPDKANPGVEGACWNPELISFPADGEPSIMRMKCKTGGDESNTEQSEIFTSVRFYTGTYAVRVRLKDHTDSEIVYDDGVVVAPLYTINSKEIPARYSEVDFEYYPANEPELHCLSWNLPEQGSRIVGTVNRSLGGKGEWYILSFQVIDGKVEYFIDNESVFSTFDPAYYPKHFMNISMQMWFNKIQSTVQNREWSMDIDWIYHAPATKLTAEQIQLIVRSIRNPPPPYAGASFVDTAGNPMLVGLRRPILRSLRSLGRDISRARKHKNKRKLKRAKSKRFRLKRRLSRLTSTLQVTPKLR